MFQPLALATFAVLAVALAPWLGTDSSEHRLDERPRRQTYPAHPDDSQV